MKYQRLTTFCHYILPLPELSYTLSSTARDKAFLLAHALLTDDSDASLLCSNLTKPLKHAGAGEQEYLRVDAGKPLVQFMLCNGRR